MNGISRTVTPPFPSSVSYHQRFQPTYQIDVEGDGLCEPYQFLQGNQQQIYPQHQQFQSFFHQSSENMNVVPHRFQTTNHGFGSQYIVNVPQQTQFSNPAQHVINQPMLQPSRLPILSYASNQSSSFQPGQAQLHGYGNPRLFCNNLGQPRPAAVGSKIGKRPKNPLPIVDPSTMKNIMEHNEEPNTSQNTGPRGMPVGAKPTITDSDIRAKFAEQVAAQLTSPQIAERLPSLPAFPTITDSDIRAKFAEQVAAQLTSPQIAERLPSLPAFVNSHQLTPTCKEFFPKNFQPSSILTSGSALTDISPIVMNAEYTVPEVITVGIPKMPDTTESMIECQQQMEYNVSNIPFPSSGVAEMANGLFHEKCRPVEKCELKNLDDREVSPEGNLVSIASAEKEGPQLEVSDIKIEKSKKKAKDINKKGERLVGTEFDAYTDDVKIEDIVTTDSSRSKQKIMEQPSKKVKHEQQPPQIPAPPAPVLLQTPTVQEEISLPSRKEILESESTSDDDGVPKDEVMANVVAKDALEDRKIVGNDDIGEEMKEVTYKYADDQWSPLNPDGKKHYDREFLLQLQYDRLAISKPAGLPDIPDIVLDTPHVMGHSIPSGSQEFDFTPMYIFNTAIGSGSTGGSRACGLPFPPSGQKNLGGSGPTRTINVSIIKDIELHKAEKAWKPCRLEPKDATTTEIEDAATAELYKKTRSILNKLTPQKFETLVSQMQALPIDTESKLKGVINLVFEKAISEPSFSVAYANMCKCLSLFKVPSDSATGDVHFRTVLLTACQLEFEKDNKSEDLFTNMREEIEKCEEGLKRDELKAELEYEETKARRRSLGNIRFIGEMFKLKMLTENIMHKCLLQLLRSRDEENLECLCRLLTTIGKELDFDKAKLRMDQYFQQMSRIVNEKKTSSRVRFMLQDVIDLRLGKWIPRQTDNNPKTIDQIHKEMEQEAHDKAFQATQSQMQQKSNHGGRRGPPEQRGGGNSDGWNTVVGARAPLKSVDRSIDPSKMKFSKHNVDESIQLGPGGGAGKFSGWMRGSTGGTSGRPSLEKEPLSIPTNRFSALSKSEEETNQGTSGASSARGEGKGHGGFGRPPQHYSRHSQELVNDEVISSAKANNDCRTVEGVGRERGQGNSSCSPQLPQEIPAIKALIPEEVEKVKAILDEYLLIHDTKEAITCIGELSELNHHQCVNNFINHVLERSESARIHTGKLLHDLVKQGVISIENYIKGLLEVLEDAEDMEIDIPKIWQYYSELISPMVQNGSVPLSFLKQVIQPLINNNKAGVLLAEILLHASRREGHKKVAALWNESGLQWSDFVPKNQVEQFLVEKGLEFTKGGDSAPTTPTTGLSMAEIWNQLNKLIVDMNADDATVFDWIDSHVDEPTRKQSNFKRALMTSVCSSAITGAKNNEKVNTEAIHSHNYLLLKFLDHKAESELQALYAVQALITKLEHPPGLMTSLFNVLYDEKVISKDTFLLWKESDEEPEGKSAAIIQTMQFFTCLHSTKDS